MAVAAVVVETGTATVSVESLDDSVLSPSRPELRTIVLVLTGSALTVVEVPVVSSAAGTSLELDCIVPSDLRQIHR